jgi:hypothetical protein
VKLSESKMLSYSEDICRKLVKLKAQQKEEDRTHKLDREKLKVHQTHQTVSTPIYLNVLLRARFLYFLPS